MVFFVFFLCHSEKKNLKKGSIFRGSWYDATVSRVFEQKPPLVSTRSHSLNFPVRIKAWPAWPCAWRCWQRGITLSAPLSTHPHRRRRLSDGFFGVIVWARAINWSFPSIIFILILNYSSRVYSVLWLLKKNKWKMQWSGHDPMALCEWSLSGQNVKWRTRSVFLKALLSIYDDFDWLLHHIIIFSKCVYVCDCVAHWFSFIFVCANSRLVVRINIFFFFSLWLDRSKLLQLHFQTLHLCVLL